MALDALTPLEAAAALALAELDERDWRRVLAAERRLAALAELLEVSVAASSLRRRDPRRVFAAPRMGTRATDD